MLGLKNNDHLFKGIFLFIFIISGNYLGELLGCRLINLLEEDIIIKHLLGFLTLYLTLSYTIDLNTSLIELFKISCILYVIFILSSKTTKYINYLLMFIFIITFIVQLYEDRLNNKKKLNFLSKKEETNLKYVEQYNKYIFKTIIIIMFIGVLIYIGEQKRSYKNNFNYFDFIFGKKDCNKGEENINIPSEYLNSLKYIFK